MTDSGYEDGLNRLQVVSTWSEEVTITGGIRAYQIKNEDGDILGYTIEGIGDVPVSAAEELANFILTGTGPNVGPFEG